MHCLTIDFQSIQLNNNLIHDNDKVKISVISLPGNDRQSITIDPKNMTNLNDYIKFNIANDAKKLIFILEKKNIFQLNPMIASRAIDANNLPNSPTDTRNIEQKTFDLYKPIHCQNDVSDPNSRIVGKMIIQFSFSNQISFKNKKNPFYILKVHNGEGYSETNRNDKNDNTISLLNNEFVN